MLLLKPCCLLVPCQWEVGTSSRMQCLGAARVKSGRSVESDEQELGHTGPWKCGGLLKGFKQEITWSYL